MGIRAAICALGIAVAACGNYGTYSPPIRSTSFGAPGHLRRGDIEVGAALAMRPMGRSGIHASIVPSVAGAARDWMSAEVAAEIATQAMLGHGGLRLTPKRFADDLPSLAFDFAFGGGAGVGGVLCGNAENPYYEPGHVTTMDSGRCPDDWQWDGTRYADRFATGAWAELGLGLRVNYRVMFLWRPRFQASWSEGLPETIWGSFNFGPHFRFHLVDFHFSFGTAAYYNDVAYDWHMVGEFGAAFLLGRRDP